MINIPTVVIVGADKGGVGKTTISRALLDYFTAHGVDYQAYDTEPEPGVLKRFFPAKTEIVDLTTSDGQMKVFDNLTKAKVTVIDCKAGLLSETLKTLSDIGFLAAVKENKVRVTVLHVLGATKASFEEIKLAAGMLTGANHLLVTNHINDTAYFGWDSDEAKQTLAAATAVIDVPKLDELAMEHVGQASVGFGAYANNVADNSFVLRGKVTHWLGKVFAAFSKAALDPNQ